MHEGQKLADHFTERRKGKGFEFEIEAAWRDILKENRAPAIVDHAASLLLARSMQDITLKF